VAFRFAEQFGPDYATQRAEIERLLKIGQLRKDAHRKARALQMLIVQPNGKPRRYEPARIAHELKVRIPTVEGWIDDFRHAVAYLVKHARVSRAQAWDLIKNPSPWAALERGIERSKAGRHASSRPRRRSGW
jgi:hypothetical protein